MYRGGKKDTIHKAKSSDSNFVRKDIQGPRITIKRKDSGVWLKTACSFQRAWNVGDLTWSRRYYNPDHFEHGHEGRKRTAADSSD